MKKCKELLLICMIVVTMVTTVGCGRRDNPNQNSGNTGVDDSGTPGVNNDAPNGTTGGSNNEGMIEDTGDMLQDGVDRIENGVEDVLDGNDGTANDRTTDSKRTE